MCSLHCKLFKLIYRRPAVIEICLIALLILSFALQMTVVEAYVGKKNINPPDESSQLHPVASSLLIEGIAQNTTGNVFLSKVSVPFYVISVNFLQ